VNTTTASGGVAGLRGSSDGYIRTALAGARNGLSYRDYRRGGAPAWARRVLEASEARFGKPSDSEPPRGRPRKVVEFVLEPEGDRD
jgi:hypothetical protein